MKIVIIDDEPIAIEFLEVMLKNIEGIEVIGKYTNPKVALQDCKVLDVDVVLLDMELGVIHGIDYAEKLLTSSSHIEIIFVTAHPQFAVEAFEVNAIDYLLKPVSINRLKKALMKVKEKIDIYNVRKEIMEKRNHKIYIYTMKSFRILDHQLREVKWRTKKAKELFAFLWHNKDIPVHKARILEELWPEVNVKNAVTLMHTTVYQLRKTLKEIGMENPISLVNDRYTLNISTQSDTEELNRLLNLNDISSANSERILEIYSGDYLEEDGFSWAIEYQQELKQLVLNYFDCFIDKTKDLDKQNYIIGKCLEKMLQLDLYNESYMQKLMEYYGITKNLIKLKELYQKIELTLKEELEIEVPQNIMKLYKQQLGNFT